MPAPGVATYWVSHLYCTFSQGSVTDGSNQGWNPARFLVTKQHVPGAGMPTGGATLFGLGSKGSFLQFSQGYYVPALSLAICPDLSQYLRMAVLANVHLSKGAGVSHTNDLYCKVAKEVYDL